MKTKLLTFISFCLSIINWIIIINFLGLNLTPQMHSFLLKYIDLSLVFMIISVIIIRYLYGKKLVTLNVLRLSYFVNIAYLIIYILYKTT